MGRVQRINDIIDNERLQRSQSMTMSSMTMNKYGVRDTKLPEAEVDERAECLVKMFGAPGSKALYCDAVRYLTKAFLDEKIKVTMEKGIDKPRYFGAIVYKKLKSIGVYS